MSGLAIRLGALAVVAWLSGLFYLWAKEGFKGRRDWQIMLESLVVGVTISSIIWFVFTLALGWVFQVSGAEIILSLTALAEQGLAGIKGTKAACATVWYLVVNYLVSLACGCYLRERQEAEKPFSVPVKSALDIEMLEIRKKKCVPLVTVKFADGREVHGKCLKYSFSEPRELVLEETANTGERRVKWLRVDANVCEIAIVARQKEQKGKRRLIFLHQENSSVQKIDA